MVLFSACGVGDELVDLEEPIASFIIDPVGDCNNDCEVIFRNTSKNASFYEWDYGDGTSSTESGATHSHIYATAGDYTVSLTAKNNISNNSFSQESLLINKIQLNIATFQKYHITGAPSRNFNEYATHIIESSSGEYFVLGIRNYEYNYSKPLIIKLNRKGEFINEMEVDLGRNAYQTTSLIEFDNKLYLGCYIQKGNTTRIVEVNKELTEYETKSGTQEDVLSTSNLVFSNAGQFFQIINAEVGTFGIKSQLISTSLSSNNFLFFNHDPFLEGGYTVIKSILLTGENIMIAGEELASNGHHKGSFYTLIDKNGNTLDAPKGNLNFTFFNSIIEGLEGEIVITGRTASFRTGILAISSTGLERLIGIYNFDDIGNVRLTTEKELLFCGTKSNEGKALIGKVNNEGENLFPIKFYENGNRHVAKYIIQTSDGGYLMVGNTENSDGTSDIMLIKTDQNGNVN